MKHTEIIFLIDKSGSMYHLADDTIGGFNGFVASQKDDAKTTLTTVLFDTTWKTLHDGIDIYEIEPMTNKDYIAGGGTAMLDAIGETINRIQNRHDELGAEKPDNVMFVITTDGEENSSRKFTKAEVEKMIKHQTNGHGWEFIFLGANMDAVNEAKSIGINESHAHAYDYSDLGTFSLYETVSCAATELKSCASLDGFDLSATYDACMSNIADTAKVATYDDCITSID